MNFDLFGYKESTGKAKKKKDKKIGINLLKVWRKWTVRTRRTQRKNMDRKEILFYFKIIKENKKWHGFF